MKAKFIKVILLLLIPSFHYAQYKRLFISDAVPDVKFENVRNYAGPDKRLSDFKGKYIILDFWSKYCTSCIAAFPKLQKLQEQFKNDMQILLVTYNTEEDLSELFQKSPILKSIHLPMVLGDSILNKLMFPHNGVPYHVWLDKDMKIIATTDGENATGRNIERLIRGEQLNLNVRVDVTNDDEYDEFLFPNKPLLTINNGRYFTKVKYYSSHSTFIDFPAQNFFRYDIFNKRNIMLDSSYSLFINRLPGWGTERIFLTDTDNNKIGWRIINWEINHLIRFAYEFPPSITSPQSSGRIFFDSTVIKPIPSDPAERNLWSVRNRYCYEVVAPNFTDKKGIETLKKDLHQLFDITASIEQFPFKCYIIYTIKKNLLPYSKKEDPMIFENTMSKAGIIFSNWAINGIVQQIAQANNLLDHDPIFLNETNITDGVPFTMTLRLNNLRDIPVLKKELSRYGLGLREETRIMKALIVKKSIANIRN